MTPQTTSGTMKQWRLLVRLIRAQLEVYGYHLSLLILWKVPRLSIIFLCMHLWWFLFAYRNSMFISLRPSTPRTRFTDYISLIARRHSVRNAESVSIISQYYYMHSGTWMNHRWSDAPSTRPLLAALHPLPPLSPTFYCASRSTYRRNW